MIAVNTPPADRAAFDVALNEVLSDHATLRHLAVAATLRPSFSTDDILTLADAMDEHERNEAHLFSLPFLPRAPAAVTTSAARAHLLCHEYTSGMLEPETANDVAAQFVDALLAHLNAEDTWLEHERALKTERRMTAI